MMSRKGDFPREKRKCSFRRSWKQSCSSCIDMPNGVIIGVVLKHLCGKKMQQRQEANVDIEVVEGDMYKIHSLEYSLLYMRLLIWTRSEWHGLVMTWRLGKQIGYHHLLPVDSAIRLPILENASLLAFASEWSEEWCMRLPQTWPFLCPVVIWALHIILRRLQHSAECRLE